MREINVLAERLLFGIGQVSLTTALVILPLLALRKLLRKRYPARTLCLIWAVLVARLLVPVQFSLPQAAPVQVTPRLTRVSYVQDALHSGQLPAPQTPAESGEWVQTAEVPAQTSGTVHYGLALFLIWGCGALGLLARQLGASTAFTRRVRRSSREVDAPALLAAYCDEGKRLKLRKSPPLRYSDEVDSPLLAGLFRPVLLLPAAGVEGEAAPLVLRHELVHYRRRDLWLKLAAIVARCVHWFNPAVYLLTRALFEDIELACDSAVVEGLDSQSRKRYGEAILDCAEHQCMARQTLTTCFANDKKALKTRLSELFVSGTKKRGIALVVLCALTVGIVGGAVYIGGNRLADTDIDTGTDEDEILTKRTLNSQIEQYLVNRWIDAQKERDYELMMPYLTEEMQRSVFEDARSYYDSYSDSDSNIAFDPDAPHYGVPEDVNEHFWRFGVSSPYVDGGKSVHLHWENNSIVAVLNWHASVGFDYRTSARLSFAREKGEWRISQIDATGENQVDSAEHFRLFYENNLGLPDFLSEISAGEELLYDLSDPVSAAEQCLFLTGGHGEVTGQETVDGHFLGNIVTYTFADGSTVDILMSDQYGEGYIPVDWRIDGVNSRTIDDIAQQWAYGTMHKDTHLMFPLLNERGTDALLEVQRNYSGDDWVWKHGKYGSSPTVLWFDVADTYDNVVTFVYDEYGGGYFNHHSVERLTFVEENGWKLDHWDEIERTDESMAQWYDDYYDQFFLFDEYPDATGISAEEAILWVAGLQNGDLSAEMAMLRETSATEDGKHRYIATLRFTDGSGTLQVKASSRPGNDGSTIWTLDRTDVELAKS